MRMYLLKIWDAKTPGSTPELFGPYRCEADRVRAASKHWRDIGSDDHLFFKLNIGIYGDAAVEGFTHHELVEG